MYVKILDTSADDLRALLMFAADKKDCRNYLRGICFDAQAGLMVATNGHAALAIKADFTHLNAAKFVIDRADIERAIKLTGKKNPQIEIGLSAAQGGELRAIELTTCNGQVLAREIDGRFPDWLRIVPEQSSGEIAHYNPDIICDMFTAFRLATRDASTWPNVFMNGNSAALVACGNSRVLGVIMPYRVTLEPETVDAWRDAALASFGVKARNAPLAVAA